MPNTHSTENIAFRLPGIPVLIVGILLSLAFVPLLVRGAIDAEQVGGGVPLIVASVVSLLTGILFLRSLVLVNPNHSKMVLLFGKYTGTIRASGRAASHPQGRERQFS